MLTFILMTSLFICVPDQDAKPTLSVEQNPDCSSKERSQPDEERDSLIREAEKNQFTVRRVEFTGNLRTRDYTLRRKMIGLNEGDIFSRESLLRSLENVSKLKKIIHPAKLSDVTIRLNREYEAVDINICFVEKKGSR